MPTNLIRTNLLATDQQRSVLSALDLNPLHHISNTPYGHRSKVSRLLSLLGFNGELLDPLTGHYHLGNGYRQFNPGLMRFNSPDSWSPFGEGGVNAYAYCGGDPINRQDPSGHTFAWLKTVLRELGLMRFPNRRTMMVQRASPRAPDIAQINTKKNMHLPIPDDARPGQIIHIQNTLESKRQNHVFQLERFVDAQPIGVTSRVKQDGQVKPLRRHYSRLVAQHYNAARTEVVTARSKTVTFAHAPSIREFEVQVPEPVGGWTKVASIRK